MLARVERLSQPASLEVLPHSAPIKILVVDDDECIRELLSLHLSQGGYDVRLAEDAVAAGRMVLKDNPDLMITDVNLPYMDGLELVSVIRADKTIPFFPVIFLTAEANVRDRAQALGAVCLIKPARADRLLAAVAAQLSVRSSQPRLVRVEPSHSTPINPDVHQTTQAQAFQ